jgi:nuclear transport factor 2 (NTF2) superfamily protein
VEPLEYRLIKELWAFTGNRIAVRYAYEYHDDSGQWFRAYGNENWEFAEDGLMQTAIRASTNTPSVKPSASSTGRWGGARMITQAQRAGALITPVAA